MNTSQTRKLTAAEQATVANYLGVFADLDTLEVEIDTDELYAPLPDDAPFDRAEGAFLIDGVAAITLHLPHADLYALGETLPAATA